MLMNLNLVPKDRFWSTNGKTREGPAKKKKKKEKKAEAVRRECVILCSFKWSQQNINQSIKIVWPEEPEMKLPRYPETVQKRSCRSVLGVRVLS